MPFEIPDSWEWVRIKDIAISELGKTLDKGKNSGEFYDYLCALNVKWGAFDLATVKQILLEDKEKERYLVRKGDLLICEGGDVGRAAIWENEKEIYYQNALHRVRFKGGIDQYFYLYALQYYKHLGFIDDVSGGVTIKHFTQNSMQKLLFPLPPLQEQKRIAYSIVQWFALIDEIEANKKDLQEYIKQTKSKVLDLAIHGKLVPQDPNDEPAIELLKRINPHFVPCDTSHYENLPFEIPTSWQWLKHNDVISIVGGSQPPKSNFVLEPRAEYVRLYQIRDYGTSPVPVYIPIKLAQKFTSKGDILLARYGGSLGKVFVAEEGAYNVAMAKVVFNYADIIYKNFAYYYYLSDIYQAKLKSISRTAQVGFNSSDFADMWFPIPPYNEQKRIVERIETIFAQLDTITAEL
ncbi:MAG: restriction endonuclease subunit S [Bacteroidales bacterium]|nr:restriction endonuclease subunit S [Bacteroidales bacterium]